MARFRDNNIFNDWDAALPDEPNTQGSLQPIWPDGELKGHQPGAIPSVNTGGMTGGAKQVAVDLFSGFKEQAGYNKVHEQEFKPGAFFDPIKGAASMLYTWATGPLRVGAEASLDVFRDPRKSAQPVEIKNPILKALLGTDTIVPLGQQAEAMGERYGKNPLTVGLFGAFKGIEAQGVFLPSSPKLTPRVPLKNAAGEIARTRTGAIIYEGGKAVLDSAGRPIIEGTGPFELIINKGLKPVVAKTIGRVFREDVSPVVKYIGGTGEYNKLTAAKLPGEGVDVLAQKLELWVRQLILEQETHGTMNVNNPGYMDALMKIPDEKVLENLYRLPGTPAENLVKADNFFKTTDLNAKLDKGDIWTSLEKAKKQALDAIDEEAKAVLKDPEFKKTLESLPEDQRQAFADKLVEANKKSLMEEASGSVASKQSGPVASEAVVPEPNRPIVPYKVLGEREITSAVNWAKKNITSDTATINNFFEKFPQFEKFAPRYFREAVGPDGTVNVAKFLEEVQNSVENSKISFKPGTKSEQLAQQMESNGYYPGYAPETVKGAGPLGTRFKETSGYLAQYGPKEVVNPLSPEQLTTALKNGLRVGEQGAVGKALTSAGLSPKPVPYGQISQAMKTRFGKVLTQKIGGTKITNAEGVTMSMDMLYRELRDLAYNKSLHGGGAKGSLRTIDSLKPKDISIGLNVSEATAKAIYESVIQSKNISTSLVGTLPKLVNALRATPYFGPIMTKMVDATYYGHFEISAAHAARYSFKTTLLAGLEGTPVQAGRFTGAAKAVLPDLSRIKLPNIFGGEGVKLPNLKNLVGERLTDRSHMIIEDFILRDSKKGFDKLNDTDLAVSDYFRVSGETQARSHNVFLRLAEYNEREEAGLIIEAFGRRRGLTGTQEQVIEGVAKDATMLTDAKQVVDGIIGYREGYLTSPFAKTLNIALYPSRFDAKVAMLTSEWLVKQNPLVQKTLFSGLQNMVNWTQSDEGKEWIRQNDKYLKVLNNLSPYATIGESIGAVAKGDFADAGLMGGLPLGFVQSVLTEAGIMKNNYVNPETQRGSSQDFVRGPNRALAAYIVVGFIRHFFPMPIYTFSLQKLHSPMNWAEDEILKGFGVTNGRDPYGPNPYIRPRPDHILPPDTPEPWKSFLEGFLGEGEEE